ncbi:MAG TPA: hypothetical protein VG457_02460, partial [Planctomycetota bacterium]|nr:hypothetical protein [Planctomycetota bacterium]
MARGRNVAPGNIPRRRLPGHPPLCPLQRRQSFDMRTVATVEARMSSSRLPGKVLLPVEGKPVLQHLLERLRRARKVDEIVLAT